jgi:hypothetical protein
MAAWRAILVASACNARQRPRTGSGLAAQRIHVGMIHARKVVNVAADGNSFQVSS